MGANGENAKQNEEWTSELVKGAFMAAQGFLVGLGREDVCVT